jgi:Domain of unknown function (DUF892)
MDGVRGMRKPRRFVFPEQKDLRWECVAKTSKTMNDLFVRQLQDIYYAEQQLVKALPKMAEKATDKHLKQGFLTHLDETKTHVQRLEQVFRMHGAEVKGSTARRSTELSRRPTRSRVRSQTGTCWMRR